ncbi:hypothetical protein LRR80_01859 [Streptomyces sp. RO-S4]|uniref:hypothetical protein n=1 Tax=Streptomyces sp. RO-S4 TaxID=2902486 RepID=UPI00208FDAC6|nr:hypothetical protein [Streptomyces sp. RO-S4]MCO4695807.1 hypothetical protein [Streptomyces sp. RO-S4]
MKSPSEMTEREYFAALGARPGMFVGTGSFPMAAAFLTGHDEHARERGGRGLTGWHEWLAARSGGESEGEQAWPTRVLRLALPGGWESILNLPSDDERHAIKVLFELLDEFMAERESA